MNIPRIPPMRLFNGEVVDLSHRLGVKTCSDGYVFYPRKRGNTVHVTLHGSHQSLLAHKRDSAKPLEAPERLFFMDLYWVDQWARTPSAVDQFAERLLRGTVRVSDPCELDARGVSAVIWLPVHADAFEAPVDGSPLDLSGMRPLPIATVWEAPHGMIWGAYAYSGGFAGWAWRGHEASRNDVSFLPSAYGMQVIHWLTQQMHVVWSPFRQPVVRSTGSHRAP